MRLIYLLIVGVLSAVLAFIAVFGEGILRTHGADVIVVIWLFFLIRMVTMFSRGLVLVAVLAIALFVEVGQMFDVAGQLGLAEGRGARLAFGTTFDPLDFIAYTVGGVIAYFADGPLAKGRS